MNKDEILARSRQENKDRDLFELSVDRGAGRIGVAAMFVAAFILTVINVFQTGRLDLTIWIIVFAVDTAMYIYKAVRLRTKKSVVMAVITVAAEILVLLLFFGDLFGIR